MRQLKARLRNAIHSLALVGGIGLITVFSAYALFGRGGIIWAVALVAILALFGPAFAPEAIMKMFKARPLEKGRATELVQIVQELTQRAGLRAAPQIFVIPSPALNAFAIGSRSHAVIGVTEGILRRLELRELAGVLAHEISHVRNNDIWVMSLADVLSRLTRFMSIFAIILFFLSLPGAFFASQPVPWLAIGLLYFAPLLSSLLQLALSRSREYEADLGAATLTGDPAALASALNKLERYQGNMWEDMFMPNRRIPAPSVLRTHPETASRVERLLQLKGQISTPALPISNPSAHVAGYGTMPPWPRFHWTGFWF